MRSISSSRADRNRIGTSEVRRISRQTSSPSISGMPTSSTTRLGRAALEARERRRAVGDRRGHHAGLLQREADHLADMRVVVGDKDVVRP